MTDTRIRKVYTDGIVRRRRVREVALRGSDPQSIKILRQRVIKYAYGPVFVYRESPRSTKILVSNHEVEGRGDLFGVYDRNVSAAMLRQDFYNEEPEEMTFAKWGKERAA